MTMEKSGWGTKKLPILSDDFVAAAKLALASNKQGKYFEMHQTLLSEPGRADKEKALRIAKDLGLDTDQLNKRTPKTPTSRKRWMRPMILLRSLA